MKIKELYLDDFIKEINKAGYEIVYNDENGIYHIKDLNLIIKKWNRKIQIAKSSEMTDEILTKIIKLLGNSYCIEYEEKTKGETNEDI